MATFNGGAFLQEQIDSILQQSIAIDEFIVSDDGSTDNTIEILSQYQVKGKLQYSINPIQLGVVANFKNAVQKVNKGNDIAFADQDDIWFVDKLEKLQQKLELIRTGDNLPSVVYSDLILVDADKKIINKSFWNELNHHHHKHCLETLLFGNFVTGCSMMINYEASVFLMDCPSTILHDVWMAFVGSTLGTIDKVDETLLMYRQHQNNNNYSFGNKKSSLWNERLKRFKRLFIKNHYLNEEYLIAQTFVNKYSYRLDNEIKELFHEFLSSVNKTHFSTIQKEIALKKFFKGKWL
jgi:glycosyltransferase involved in cell wall biosynthesis